MQTDDNTTTAAGGSPVDRGVRPVAEIVGGVLRWHIPAPDYSLARHYLRGVHMLYDQAALDLAAAEAHQLARDDFDLRAQQRDERDEMRDVLRACQRHLACNAVTSDLVALYERVRSVLRA